MSMFNCCSALIVHLKYNMTLKTAMQPVVTVFKCAPNQTIKLILKLLCLISSYIRKSEKGRVIRARKCIKKKPNWAKSQTLRQNVLKLSLST